jgi:hypothetical protein
MAAFKPGTPRPVVTVWLISNILSWSFFASSQRRS